MGIRIDAPAPAPDRADPVTGAVNVEQVGSTPVSNTAAANTAVSITLTGVAGQRTRITHLSFSYSAAPTAGTVTIVVNAVTVFQLDVTGTGDQSVPLPDGGIICAAGQNAVITLTAAGAAVVGKLNTASYLGA